MRNTLRFTAALAAAFLLLPFARRAQKDTVYISDLYTTHIVFNTEIKYSDASNLDAMTAAVVDNSKNLFALTANEPFTMPANITILESNGNLHTFIVAYRQHPKKLIIDTRSGNDDGGGEPAEPKQSKGQGKASSSSGQQGNHVSRLWQKDAPPLKDVMKYSQGLYHLSRTAGKVKLVCENIFTYSDITYIILRTENRSGVSFDISDATFSIEPAAKSKRKLVAAKPIIPKNKVGSLTSAPGTDGRAAYALEKMSLSADQALVIRVFEGGEGQRNIELMLSSSDVNDATAPGK